MITCTFENQSQTSLRHVTVNAIVVKDRQILLGKRGTYRGKPLLEHGKWALLGGYFDRDETLLQAIAREVMEESGWQITDIKLFWINDTPSRPGEDRQNVDFIFLAQATEQTGTHDEEISELNWFDPNHLPDAKTVAFDHYRSLQLFKEYLDQKLQIPIFSNT